MVERGRAATSGASSRGLRSRSRSRARRVRDGEEKPLGSRIKGLMKGMGRSRRKNDASKDSTTESDAVSTTISIHQTTPTATPASSANTMTKATKAATTTAATSKAGDDKKSKSTKTESPAKAKKETPAKKAGPSLQLVLLLMDPATRRFELLQLEFDSDKARVSDIIAQIPVSVTEAAIRQQKYDGVIDQTAVKMDELTKLVDFCSGKTVLVALPKGLSVKECARLARPILSDVQVVKMVRYSFEGKRKRMILIWLCFGFVLDTCFLLSHILFRCSFVPYLCTLQLTGAGFDVSGWEKKKTEEPEVSRTRDLPAISEKSSQNAATVSANNSKKSTTASSSSSAKKIDAEPETKSGIFPIVAVLAILAIVLQTAHNFISSPIEAGVPLPPGTWRSKCGLFGYIPDIGGGYLPTCKNQYFEVNDDGTAVLYDSDQEIDIFLLGGVCKKEDCIEGLVMGTDGIVRIGGKQVNKALLYEFDMELTPWPFVEKPKMKYQNFNGNGSMRNSSYNSK